MKAIQITATGSPEVLKYVEGDQVKVSFKTPERAALITPASPSSDDDYLALVMPLRLQE